MQSCMMFSLSIPVCVCVCVCVGVCVCVCVHLYERVHAFPPAPPSLSRTIRKQLGNEGDIAEHSRTNFALVACRFRCLALVRCVLV